MRHFKLQIGLRVAGLAALLAVMLATGIIGPGLPPGGPADPASTAEVDRALVAARKALLERDVSAWLAAIPTETNRQYAGWLGVYVGLSEFHWQNVEITAEPVDDVRGRFVVRAEGQLADERLHILAERKLDLAWRHGKVTIVADRTSRLQRTGYFLAFTDPVVVRGDHLLVVGDSWQRPRILRVAAADRQAHRVVERLGLPQSRLKRETLVVVYGPEAQGCAASGSDGGEGTAGFARNWAIYLQGSCVGTHQAPANELLRHELAHVYTSGMEYGRHSSAVLSEGVAVVSETNPDYADLRGELANGNQTLPLKHALTIEDEWGDMSNDQIALAYLEGGSLVLYLEKYWGIKRAIRLARSLAGDTRLTEARVERACQEATGLTWYRFYEGWKTFVQTLP
jgi:hypothetical protein